MSSSHRQPARTIDRIYNPSEAYFRKNYLERSRPVVIVQTDPPLAQHGWTFDYLSRVAGDCMVPVYDWGDEGPTVNDHFKIIEMSLAQAIERCCSVTSTHGQRYSVCQLSIDQYLKALAREYELPPTLANAESLDRLNRHQVGRRRRRLPD